jgi:hypothetical protein
MLMIVIGLVECLVRDTVLASLYSVRLEDFYGYSRKILGYRHHKVETVFRNDGR